MFQHLSKKTGSVIKLIKSRTLNETIPNSPTTIIIMFVSFLALLWGGNVVSIKLGLKMLSPFTFTATRVLLGLIIIGAWSITQRVSLTITRKEILPLLTLSLLFLVQVFGLHVGTHLTFASHSTVMMSSYPFFTAIFSHFFLKGDNLTPRTTIGVIIAFLGVILTFIPQLENDFSQKVLLGNTIVLGSSLLLASRTILSKKMLSSISPEKLLFWMLLFNLPILLMLSLIVERNIPISFSLMGVCAILYVGVVIAGFCFLAYTTILSRYSASRVTIPFFITPVFGVFLSWTITHDPVGPNIIIGTILVATGIILSSR